MSQQQQAALRLAKMGFRVFPLKPGDKKPAVKRFPIVATTDEQQINAWWNATPNFNVGVSTTGFVVVDIDTKKGPHALAGFHNLGGDFETFVVQTATGGYHVYYTGPDSMLATDIVPGVDIRSHNGYVVGPGSYTSKENEGCVDGWYGGISDKPMAPVPLGVELLLKEPGQARQRDDDAELDTPYNIENAKVWLQASEPAIEGRGGNEATYRVCAKLVRDFALSEETAYQQIATHWNHRCIPPWEPGELWALVQHASAYGTGNLGQASPDKTFGQVVIPEPPPMDLSAPPAAGFADFAPQGAFMGNALDGQLQPPRPWRVERLLMNGEVTIVAGMGSMGKSMFQLTCAAHFALGKDFGSYKLKVPDVPMRSLVYNGEDDVTEQSRRLYGICLQFNFDYNIVKSNILLLDDRQGELTLATLNRNVPQVNQQAAQWLIQLARQNDIDIIFADPLVNLHALNENDNAQMRFIIKVLQNIARETNTALLVAHHTGKGGMNKEKGDADAIRGASALVNSPRIALLLSSITKVDAERFGIKEGSIRDYMRMDPGKANYLKKGEDAIAWLKWETVRHINGDFIGVPITADVQHRKADQDAEIAAIIRDHMRKSGVGSLVKTHAARAIVDSGHVLGKLSESGLRKIIDHMFASPVRIDNDILDLTKDGGKELITIR